MFHKAQMSSVSVYSKTFCVNTLCVELGRLKLEFTKLVPGTQAKSIGAVTKSGSCPTEAKVSSCSS